MSKLMSGVYALKEINMKKYKIGNYIVMADSPREAVKVVKSIDSQLNDAGLSVSHYKSPIDTRQTVQIRKDGREIYSFETAAEAIAFANKILSIAAKLQG